MDESDDEMILYVVNSEKDLKSSMSAFFKNLWVKERDELLKKNELYVPISRRFNEILQFLSGDRKVISRLNDTEAELVSLLDCSDNEIAALLFFPFIYCSINDVEVFGMYKNLGVSFLKKTYESYLLKTTVTPLFYHPEFIPIENVVFEHGIFNPVGRFMFKAKELKNIDLQYYFNSFRLECIYRKNRFLKSKYKIVFKTPQSYKAILRGLTRYYIVPVKKSDGLFSSQVEIKKDRLMFYLYLYVYNNMVNRNIVDRICYNFIGIRTDEFERKYNIT